MLLCFLLILLDGRFIINWHVLYDDCSVIIRHLMELYCRYILDSNILHRMILRMLLLLIGSRLTKVSESGGIGFGVEAVPDLF